MKPGLHSLLALVCALLLVGHAGARQLASEGGDTFEVRVSRVDGDIVCDVRAREASVRLLVQAIARELDYDVDGFEVLGAQRPVTAQLTQRPLGYVLLTVLGSVGLEARVAANRIVVGHEISPFAEPEEFQDRSQSAYLRAVRDYPGHRLAPHAEFHLGELQESRGNWSAARARYDSLVQNHPSAGLVPEAMYRTGLMHQRLGAWDEAQATFRELGDLENPHSFLTEARLEFARCAIELGKHQQALLMLEALDRSDPAANHAERVDRTLLRARALHEVDRPVESLRLLAGLDPKDASGLRATAVRAGAFERSGEIGRAAVAWLEFASRAEATEQAEALRQAARLAQDSGDDVGALFIVAHGKRLGFGDELRHVESAARESLGLPANHIGTRDSAGNVRVARQLLERGLFTEGRIELERSLEELMQNPSIDVIRLYARLLEGEGRVDDATEWLRERVAETNEVDVRRELFVIAAEMFERSELFERAVDAYGGKL